MNVYNKPWLSGNLRVSDNKRYLQNGDTPFFWLGDTAWLLFNKLSLEETYTYLKNRKEKGYNVIQTTLVHVPGQSTIDGATALIEDDFARPNLADGYWEHVDQVVKMAEDLGLYMGLLPNWGSCFVKNEIMTVESVVPYVEFLTKRYAKHPNIIWITGGDVRGSVNPTLFRLMGETFKKNDPDALVTFHPFGRTCSSLWFNDETWLDFNMFQSGHRSYNQSSLGAWDDNKEQETFYGEDNYKYVIRAHSNENIKPVVDAEPSYEQIPHGLHDDTQPYWQAFDVRRYAYWSVFAGAMGFTYGSNAVMQFYNDLSKKGAYGVKEVWMDALHHVGGSHMKHLVTLMNDIDYTKGLPAQQLLLGEEKEKYERVAVFAAENYILAYDYLGEEFSIDLSSYQEKTLQAYWFDPTTGVYSYFTEIRNQKHLSVKPIKRLDGGNDWVLVLLEN